MARIMEALLHYKEGLLPGAGEPLQLNPGDQQEILCNWQLDDEERLPRGDGIAGDVSSGSSGKKRKASSKESSRKKKVKENGEVGNLRHRENGSRKEKSTKKKRRRHGHNDPNGFSHGSPWSR